MKVEQQSPSQLKIDGHLIEFPQRINKMLRLGDRVIVLLKTGDFEYGDLLVGRNVLAFGPDGKMLWRVEDHKVVAPAGDEDPVTQPDENGERWVPQSFMGLWVEEDTGKIKAGIPEWIFTLDPETGSLSDDEYNW